MIVRKWKYEDILRISELEKECFPKEPWSFRMLASSFEMENFHGLLAEEDGEVIGYGGMVVSMDVADIANIAVTEQYRSGGVGGAILDELTETARRGGALKIFLEVRVSNSPAMSLYLKHGFKGVYARTRYYSDGEDCLVMAKELSDNT